MLKPTSTLMQAAYTNGYALGAFNIYNLEGVLSVIRAAESENSPVLIQIHPKALAVGGKALIAAALAAADESLISAAVHLDHSTSSQSIQMALTSGVQSVMADGSAMPYDENIAFTKAMAQLAHTQGTSIEAELGKISGTEDGLTVAEYEARMTDPQQAAEFVAQTGVDMLAVCIGNVHGNYPTTPQLDFERLRRIRDCVDIPLVMHGASGLPDEMIQQSIMLGISKFNVNTEVRQAYLQAATHALNAGFDLVHVIEAAVDAMTAVIRQKIRLFGSNNKSEFQGVI